MNPPREVWFAVDRYGEPVWFSSDSERAREVAAGAIIVGACGPYSVVRYVISEGDDHGKV